MSREGLAGGASRGLVLLNFPISLVAVAIVGVLLERGASRPLGAAAIALCAVTAWPGVVDQDDLDARLVNAVPAAGVALALALTVAARPRLSLAARRPFDRARAAVAVAALLVAVPWLFAEAGFYAPDPVLSDEVPRGEKLAAVHLGHHHGTDGVLLVLCALVLSRVARSRLLWAYLSLMLVYGAANAVQDGWLEQVEKRGWTDVGLPSLLVPELSVAWVMIAAGAAAVYLLTRGARAGRAR